MTLINWSEPIDVTLRCDRYLNNCLAVFLMRDDQEYAMVSVNLPEEDINADEFAVKTCSENSGLLGALLNAGLIEYTGRMVSPMELPVCRLKSPSPRT